MNSRARECALMGRMSTERHNSATELRQTSVSGNGKPLRGFGSGLRCWCSSRQASINQRLGSAVRVRSSSSPAAALVEAVNRAVDPSQDGRRFRCEDAIRHGNPDDSGQTETDFLSLVHHPVVRGRRRFCCESTFRAAWRRTWGRARRGRTFRRARGRRTRKTYWLRRRTFRERPC